MSPLSSHFFQLRLLVFGLSYDYLSIIFSFLSIAANLPLNPRLLWWVKAILIHAFLFFKFGVRMNISKVSRWVSAIIAIRTNSLSSEWVRQLVQFFPLFLPLHNYSIPFLFTYHPHVYIKSMDHTYFAHPYSKWYLPRVEEFFSDFVSLQISSFRPRDSSIPVTVFSVSFAISGMSNMFDI